MGSERKPMELTAVQATALAGRVVSRHLQDSAGGERPMTARTDFKAWAASLMPEGVLVDHVESKFADYGEVTAVLVLAEGWTWEDVLTSSPLAGMRPIRNRQNMTP